MNSSFLDGGGGESSLSANGGRSWGRKQAQSASVSAAAWKAWQTAAARQAATGPARASDANRRSSGSRVISLSQLAEAPGAATVVSIDDRE